MGSTRSIAVLTVLNTIAALVGLFTSIVTAYFFGTSRPLEIFFAASTLYVLVISLTQTGQISDIFLPMYIRIRQAQGLQAAQAAFSVLLNWMTLLVLAISALLWVLAPWLIQLLVPGFTPANHATGAVMFRVMVPVLTFYVIVSMISSLANAERWFGMPEAIGVFSQVVSVACILFLAPRLGIWAMVISFWIPSVTSFLGMVVVLRRLKFRHVFRLHQPGFSPWLVFSQMAYTLVYAGSVQLYAFVFNAAISLLPAQGTYAVFKYVQQLYAKTSVVFVRPISVVFFTHFSEMLAKGARDVRDLAHAALNRMLAVGMVVVVAIFVSAHPLLGALWGPDRFGEEQLDLAAVIMSCYYFLLFVTGLGLIERKMNLSLGMVGSQYLSASGAMVVAAGVAWLLIHWAGTNGAIGAVVAGEILTAAVAGAIPLLLWRRDMLVFFNLKRVLQWALAGSLAVLAGKGLAMLVPWATFWSPMARLAARVLGHPMTDGGAIARVGLLLYATMLAGTAVVLLVAVGQLVRIPEVRQGMTRLRKMLGLDRKAPCDTGAV